MSPENGTIRVFPPKTIPGAKPRLVLPAASQEPIREAQVLPDLDRLFGAVGH